MKKISRIGMVGLGTMGKLLSTRLLRAGYDVVGYDIAPTRVEIPEFVKHFKQVISFEEMIKNNVDIIWLMLPAGEAVDVIVGQVIALGLHNTIIIDGGNSHYKDSIRRYEYLQKQRIQFVDCGVSGGQLGCEEGFSLMVGGQLDSFTYCLPIFAALAAQDGYVYCGPSGAGHYVKMVHNGIEYALLQAYGEGFDILRNGYYNNLDIAHISDAWMHGALIRSYLLSLISQELNKDQYLISVSGKVGQHGTGKWTVEEAQERHIAASLIAQAVKIREDSLKTGGSFATKLIALMRHVFGGHAFFN
ncbi:MAG: NADP-dependent phosphogluconate dehydrogenase [Candidatus Babeliaceae bacterium]|jgi:6-phosphogluconate dehydrogenase